MIRQHALISIPALMLPLALLGCASATPNRVNLDPRLLQTCDRPALRLVPETMTNRDAWRAVIESDEQIILCNQNLDGIRKSLLK